MGQCGDLWHPYCDAVEHDSAAILILEVTFVNGLWSGHQPIWMFPGNEFADRLAAEGAEEHQYSECTVKKIVGVRSSARTVQRRVATVNLHMAEQNQFHSGVPCGGPS